MKHIPLAIPNLDGNELKYLKECIDTNFVSSVGRFVSDFETKFAEYVGASRAIAVVNGTAALHLSLFSLGVETDDEVLAPNLTFVAPLNAIKYLGAVPVLIDSEWQSLGMCASALESFLHTNTELRDGRCVNKSTGRFVKAVIPMHTMGNSVDIEAINSVAKKYNLYVVEDASEALGAEFNNQKIGTHSLVSCFSFNGNKIMTTGGGGMITTNDIALADRLKHLSTTAKTESLHFVHDELGFNYRMVNLLAAVGLAQLEQLPNFLETKKNNLELYKENIKKEGFSIHSVSNPKNTNNWFYNLVINDADEGLRDSFVAYMNENNVGVRPIWTLMEKLDMYKNCQTSDLSVSRDIRKKLVNIPCSSNISEEEILRVCELINSFRGSQ